MEAWAKPAGNLTAVAASRRHQKGILALALALGLAVAMAHLEASAGWRLLLFIPFFLTAFGFFQGLYRT